MDYSDSGHVPHARWTGETPETPIDYGPEGIKVELLDWGPNNPETFKALWCSLQANWGENPEWVTPDDLYGGMDYDLTTEQWAYVHKAFQGGTLQQALERFSFNFLIDGVTRACTHELVRTRVGAGFMQHGGRDNDWRHRRWTVPETIRRASLQAFGTEPKNLDCPIPEQNLEVVRQTIKDTGYETLIEWIVNYVQEGKELYAFLLDECGIPPQDARRLLHIGTQTFLYADYNFVSLKGVLSNRLEHQMDWEINCVAQLMLREVKMRCPKFMSQVLMSGSDRAGRDVFSLMGSWPPAGKYPVTEEVAKMPREYKRNQMLYWVLHPESMEGGAIRWIPTNGTWPSPEELK